MKLYFLLMALVLVSACTAGATMKDCGSDQQCLTDSIKTCTPAKGTVNFTQDNYLYVEVKGVETSKCVVYENLEGPGVQDVIDTANELTGKNYNKLDLTCKVPMNTTESKVMKELDEVRDYCQGPLLDYMLAVLENLMRGFQT